MKLARVQLVFGAWHDKMEIPAEFSRKLCNETELLDTS